MPDSSERHIKIYDLTIGPARVRQSPPSKCEASDFVDLRNAVKNEATKRTPPSDEEDGRGRRLFLMDMEIHRHHVAFVWTLADPTAAAQIYMKRGGTELRAAAKDNDEDVALSAHMVVDFDVSQGAMHYRVALEDHEGVSRSRIQRLFQKLLQEHMPSVTAVSEDGIAKSGPPRVRLEAHPGRLIRETETKPVEIEVVKRTPRQTLTADMADPFYEAIDRRVFRLARGGAFAELRARAVAKANELLGRFPGYRIRIRWRDANDPNRRDEVTEIEPQDQPELLLERALTLTVHLTGLHNLPQATSTIVTPLAARMLAAIRDLEEEDAKGAHRR